MGARQDLFQAIQEGDADKLETALAEEPSLAKAKDDNGVSAILQAAYHQKFDLADLLTSKAEELDVFEAVAVGDTNALNTLLSREPGVATAWSADGFTALHFAAFFGKEDCAKRLVAAAADVGAASKNAMEVRPINSAAAARQHGIVKLLLDHGAEVDAAQHNGWTSLHSAAHNGDEALVDLLLDHGADRNTEGENGKKPIDLARDAGHTALAERLGTTPPK